VKKLIFIPVILIGLILLIKIVFNLTPNLNLSENKISGIDISHHNKIKDWNKVKNSVNFVYIKATEGMSLKDPKFQTHWEQAKKHGIRRGAYHYFVPNVSAKKQFDNFKNSVQLSSGDLPPVIDVERKSIDMNEVNEWLRLAEEFYGVKPIIYSEYTVFKLFMNNKVNKNKLWLYFPDGYMLKPSFLNYECSFWQYNHSGKIDGIDGHVDLDVFYGNPSDFEKLLKE